MESKDDVVSCHNYKIIYLLFDTINVFISIWVNDQWRVIFKWNANNASEVEIWIIIKINDYGKA